MLLRRLIGLTLRRTRQRQGLTLREVAALARVSVAYLSEVERGRKEASSEVLAAICRALGLRLADLLDEIREELALTEPALVPGRAPLPRRAALPSRGLARRDPLPSPGARAPGEPLSGREHLARPASQARRAGGRPPAGCRAHPAAGSRPAPGGRSACRRTSRVLDLTPGRRGRAARRARAGRPMGQPACAGVLGATCAALLTTWSMNP